MTIFHKMHGLGNHFVIVDARGQDTDPTLFFPLADGCTGIGYDQLIILQDTPSADLEMIIHNADGSGAGMCGNAARCVAWLECRRLDQTHITMRIGNRVVEACLEDNQRVRVDMGPPQLDWSAIPLRQACDTLALPGLPEILPQATGIGMGNPHCVLFYDDLTNVDVATLGPSLETHPLFPERANIEFVKMENPHTADVIVWERGAGLTKACGSGACAVGVAAIRRGLGQSPVTVCFPGGNLCIEWNGGADDPVFMTGPVAYVYEGKIPMAI